MPSLQKILLIRLLEKFLLGVFILLTAGAYYVYQLKILNGYQMLGYAAALLVSIAGVLLMQRMVTGWLHIAVSQTSFATEEEFSSLYDRSPVAYLTIDTGGKVQRHNQAAVHLFQATADTLKLVNFYQRLVLTDTINPSILKGKIQAGITINDMEVLLESAAGTQVWVLLSVYLHQDKNLRLISLMDITQQKIVDTAKSEFVALATHQLRTPISAIRWNVELLERNLRETVTEDQIRYLTKIERNVMRMISLINDFLSVSKLEMGTFAAKEEELNLSEFFDSVLDEFTEKITQKRLTLVRDDIPPQAVIKTDSRLFHIIVSNLLSNAVKYVKQDGQVTLTYQLQGEKLKIVISDNGIGVPAAEYDRLFTKFFRASNAQTQETEGTGLGLYVVKQSVEMLRGHIIFESVENEGTTFTIEIPVRLV